MDLVDKIDASVYDIQFLELLLWIAVIQRTGNHSTWTNRQEDVEL
jgi:hypothetical protein